MSKQDRLDWIKRGSPFTLMRPAARLRDTLRAHGYTVYDIGNRQHLEHEPPEDHTPYSETGYPGRAKRGIGYAIDIMPPSAGRRSGINGRPLPPLRVLGAQMVADRGAGVPGIRWLKYQNWEPEGGGGPCYKDSWRPRHKRTSSTDRGHIHQSGLTGFETSSTGDDYDPVARIYGEDDDMPLTQAEKLDIARLTAKEVWGLRDKPADGVERPMGDALWNVFEALLLRRADSNVVQDMTAIKANLNKLLGKDFVNEQEVVDGVLAGLGAMDLDKAATALRAAFGDRASELAAKLAAPRN